jgi:inhibitor of KinA
MEITPLGDSAVLVRLTGNFEADPEGALEKVLTAQQTLIAARIPGVIELAPAYTTVALFYDPIRAIEAGAPVKNLFEWIEQQIRETIGEQVTAKSITARVMEVPVCYDAEFALDLAEVARRASLEPDEVISLHSGAEYRVHCIGFTPGFPFLGGLSSKLATPRRETPRTEIPAGSVGIGGKQTGIYPVKSPGGWNVIGRTPLRLFDPQENPPVLMRAGDRVRFRPISRDEFERSTAP